MRLLFGDVSSIEVERRDIEAAKTADAAEHAVSFRFHLENSQWRVYSVPQGCADCIMPIFPLFNKYEVIEALALPPSFFGRQECRLKILCSPGLAGRLKGHKPYTFEVEGRENTWYYCRPKVERSMLFDRGKMAGYSLDPLFNGLMKKAWKDGIIDKQTSCR